MRDAIERMLSDVQQIEQLYPAFPSQVRDLCCHVKALAAELERVGKVDVPAQAWTDPNFRRAIGILWGYYRSPEPLFTERFGNVDDPWKEMKRLMEMT